ncbi:MAG: GGDEF domain-containing protein [Myxococcota bacterium]|jgi:diguanylate cyclase (GGDEF)-like protein|nr:GGDEF domain-containing protein [Myxococcota bacterium]
MFWKKAKPAKKKTAPTPRPKPAADDASVGADQSLDLLADLLRIYGEGAFDLEEISADEIRERSETWARHLVVGVEPPDRPSEADEWQGGASAPRDLPGVRRFVGETRREEHRYIGQSFANMFEAIWAFIGGLRHTLAFDQQTDARVAHRLHRLEKAAQGNSTARLKQEALETVSLVRECMAHRGDNQQKLLASLDNRLEAVRSELTVVREQAATDGLTGLFNRASFDEHLERLVDLHNLFGRPVALFMIDIDHFKWVNDTYGHTSGDMVLKEVAGSLAKSFLRKEDFVARFGGEEFAVALQEGRIGTVKGLAERCLQRLRDLEFEIGDEPLRISASLGVALVQPDETPQAWLERADAALYEAKQAGRDRVVIHTSDRDPPSEA